MRALLLALPGSDDTALRASLAPAIGATTLDVCQAVEATITWIENRPCDLVVVAGVAGNVVDSVSRLRRISRSLPLLAVLPDAASPDAGAAWLAGADDVITVGSLSSATLPEGLDDVRHPERDVLRRTQRLWYAGGADALRQQLVTRLGSRFRDVGLSGEGLAGLTTQDVESLQSAALVVNALTEPHELVIGVRRVKRMYPSLAITVVVDGQHHDAFKRAGADECVPPPLDVDHVLHAVGRAQASCRAALELDVVRARETRLRALLEQLPEAVVLVSAEHAVLAVNLAALRLLGAHDARQVLGSRLTPWVTIDGSEEGVELLLDGVASGASRDVVATTRQVPEARRLLLRAVPFQRESGGPPATLIVLRDLVGTTLPDSRPPAEASPDDVQAPEAWITERADLTTRIDALERELSSVREQASEVRTLQDALAAAQSQLHEADEARRVADVLHGLGLDAERLPELSMTHLRLATLEAEELPRLRAQAREFVRLTEDELPALRRRVAELEAPRVDSELAVLQEAARRLASIEEHDVPALREQAATLEGARSAAEASLREAEERIGTLERALAEARASAAGPDNEHGAIAAGTPPVPLVVPTCERASLLEQLVPLGIVTTDRDGRVQSANEHAARVCGLDNAAALLAVGRLPGPLHDLAGDDLEVASRFEICLQAGAVPAARWIGGVRLPAPHDAAQITWWLADLSARRPNATPDAARVQTLSSLLDVAATECAAVVGSTTPPLGPRRLDAVSSDDPSRRQALARAQVVLAQVSALGRSGAVPGVVDVRERLSSLAPLLARLVGDEVTWSIDVPEMPVHACVAAAAFDRCVTTLIGVARDALPLGGRLSVTLAEAAPARIDGDAVRRASVSVVLEAQGYGLHALDLPQNVIDAAHALDGRLDVLTDDPLTSRITFQLPRAFVLTQAA